MCIRDRSIAHVTDHPESDLEDTDVYESALQLAIDKATP